MNKNALIIFARTPELGKVKTRLAAGVGEAKALLIYKILLDHTKNITLKLDADKFIFYADQMVQNDIWPGTFIKKLQYGSDLGMRINNAFDELFKENYTNVIIIGSDCLELTTNIIETSFASLKINDIVIGPAKDGGYYLLGMKKLHFELFKNKAWSTESLYQQTINEIEKSGLSYKVLPVLTDIDIADDIPEYLM